MRIDILHKLCPNIWTEETFPNDWGRAIITPILKKMDKLDCGNYRDISLLRHAAKVLALILQRQILKKTEDILSESQAGYRPGRSAFHTPPNNRKTPGKTEGTLLLLYRLRKVFLLCVAKGIKDVNGILCVPRQDNSPTPSL